jgi:hypothetical protein
MGRKPIPINLKRSKRLNVQLTANEAAQIEAAATRAGAASVSEFVRDLIFSGIAKKAARK